MKRVPVSKRSVRSRDAGRLRVLVAPDSFKESLSAKKAAEAIRKGILLADPRAEVVMFPLADGGEGTLDAIQASVPAKWITRTVKGPLDKKVRAKYLEIDGSAVIDPVLRKKLGLAVYSSKSTGKTLKKTAAGIASHRLGLGKIALIEMAQAAGFQLLSESQRDPGLTNTFGVGELIKDALNRDIGTIILTVGGSATNDGGTGMAAALGYRYLGGSKNATASAKIAGGNAKMRTVDPRGSELNKITLIDDTRVDPRIAQTAFFVAADVTNPFFGPKGAAQVYSPQKGAGPAQVTKLDSGLKRLAGIVKKQYKIDLQKMPGSGAAGGLAGGAAAFLNAKIISGTELIAGLCGLKEKAWGEIAISGKGRGDAHGIALGGKSPATITIEGKGKGKDKPPGVAPGAKVPADGALAGMHRGVDLCIVAEGRFDKQSMSGKAPFAIAKMIAPIPTIVLAGSVCLDLKTLAKGALPITAAFSIQSGPMSLEESRAQTAILLKQAAFQVIRVFKAGNSKT